MSHTKIIVSVVCVLLISAVCYFSIPAQQKSTTIDDVNGNATITVGTDTENKSVTQPSADDSTTTTTQTETKSASALQQNDQADPYAPSAENPYGRVRPVAANTNKTVAAVAKAMQPETRDKRQLTVLAEPTPWDRATYIKDPAAYTEISEPARAFRPAQPAADVPRLERIGSNAVRLKQGTSTELRVRTEPFMPVTFTSLDMARFGNQLTSQTVAADKFGIATVTFHAATGTLYDTDVQAASPVASGVVRWIVSIDPVVASLLDQDEQDASNP